MGIDSSSSFCSISNRYEGRFVRVSEFNNTMTIYDKEVCTCDSRNSQLKATTDQKEAQLQHRHDVSTIDLEEAEEEPVPYIILVQGPPNVGKSMLIKSLVKFFTMHHLNNIRGPITVVAGKYRRLQFVECPNDVNGMIDAAKYADLALVCIDASYGFEMETLEFVNLLQVHGFPNVIGVLSHLDKIKPEGKLMQTKQRLSRQFRNEIHSGAELFYLSCLDNGMYVDDQIHKLAMFISVMKFNPLSWQTAHPYLLVDRFEDVTSLERVHSDNKCDRNIVMYGYLRGSNFKKGTKVHIAGVGDFPVYDITSLADPCSLPFAANMKGVSDKERLFYAPMSGLGDLLYDKDAEYIDEPNDIDEVTRRRIEGFRAGTYLKLEAHAVPFEMTKNIDPCFPMLVGGISLEEENVGYMQTRLKRHSCHMKLLKTRDPIIVSVGWRRYQTRPIYAQEDGSNRLHRIHSIPKHTDCLAMFWGPLAPPGTGFVAVQNPACNKAAFRISAMGVILDFTQAAQVVAEIVKKHKQVGTPLKICKKTARIKDMFTSDLEIDWFKGAAIQTARGVRGNVKKVANKKLVSKLIRKGDQSREDIGSCSFQHETFLSDKDFMRVWKQVGAVKDSSNFIGQGMETVGELKDSLDKDDPARRQQVIEQRRAVMFTEKKPRTGTLPMISKKHLCKRMPKECEELYMKDKEFHRELSKRDIERSKEIVKGRGNLLNYIRIGH